LGYCKEGNYNKPGAKEKEAKKPIDTDVKIFN